jgi:hypothetical protein
MQTLGQLRRRPSRPHDQPCRLRQRPRPRRSSLPRHGTAASTLNPMFSTAATKHAPTLQVSAPATAPELHASSGLASPRTPRRFSEHGAEDRDPPGDHWVTIDGQHVLIHEPQGNQNQSQAQPQPEEGQRGHELLDNREVAVHAFRLFESSGFGSTPTEHSMWVVSKDGRYEFLIWPWSAAAGKETWKGPAPDGAIAVIHTHPSTKSERPSDDDHDLADGKQDTRIRMPVYVLHRNGIWKAVPGKKYPIRVRESRWVNDFKP